MKEFEMEAFISAADQITRAFLNEFGHFTEEKLNWKPSPQSWSIAQNIDHLITLNRTYFPLIERAQKQDYSVQWFGKIKLIHNFWGKILLKSVSPDRNKKTTTFAVWEPSKSTFSKDILKQFEEHQKELKQRILDSKGLLEKSTIISSPASRYIVYPLSSAFEIILTHERRHYNQAKEVAAQMPN